MKITQFEDYIEILSEDGKILTNGEIETNRVCKPIGENYDEWLEIDEIKISEEQFENE